MTAFLIGLIGAAALVGVWMNGVHWAFRWIYLPVIILIPTDIVLGITGLPDLTGRRAACLGLLLGAVMTAETNRLLPRWHWFDILAFVPVMTLSVSYSLDTDFKGFYYCLADLGLDWVCPYLLVRGLLRDADAVRAAMRPLGLCTIFLAGVAVYECRMATHVVAGFWEQFGFDVFSPRFCEFRRWGYLRAAATLGGALPLGTFFATAVPLMVLWGWRESKLYWTPRLACIAGVCGCLMVIYLFAVPKKAVTVLIIGVLVVASPFLLDIAGEKAHFTDTQMEVHGNVSSGYYRIALLQIYGKRIPEVGWWGDKTVRENTEYKQAWSIDNAYLYIFLLGGWLGGGAFCLIVLTLLVLGASRIKWTCGTERKALVATFASFIAVSVCLANVWFAEEIEPFFWISAALLLNAVYQGNGHRRNARTAARVVGATTFATGAEATRMVKLK